MSDDAGYRTVAKLVLLQQACCDPRLKGSHTGTLAVILDHCYDKPRCYIGPTAIGKIANLHARTVYGCIDDLQQAGYLRVEPRSKRSNWVYPNLDYAEQIGCLVSYSKEGRQRVHRPVNTKAIAGLQTRKQKSRKGVVAGLQTNDSGPAGQSQRVHRPEEAVIEAIEEAVGASRSSSKEEVLEQARESLRAEYLATLKTHPKHARGMWRNFPKQLEGLDPPPAQEAA